MDSDSERPRRRSSSTGVNAEFTGAAGDSNPRSVRRERVIQQLTDVMTRNRLALVSAPAGYGKSALLTDWKAWTDANVVTVSGDGIGHRLIDPASATLRAGDVIVVDESDARRTPLSIRTVERLVAELPPTVHVVASRRSPWPSSVLGLTGDGGVGHITERELAFCEGEAGLLVRGVAGENADDWPLDELVDRTGGWAAGLVLVALAARDQQAESLGAGLDVAARHTGAYVGAEVLASLSDADCAFLLETSLLEPLAPSVCDAVTGRSDSARVLRRLYRRGAISRSDAQPEQTYRRHPLFRQHLRQRFVTSDFEAARRAAELASEWFQRRDSIEVALEQHVQVADPDAILRVVGQHGHQLFERGLRRDTMRQIEPVLVTARMSNQSLLEYGFLQLWAGDGAGAARTIQSVDRDGTDCGARMAANVVKSALVRHQLRAGEARRAAQAVLDAYAEGVRRTPDIFGLTSADDLALTALHHRGLAAWYEGDLAGARADLEATLHPLPRIEPWVVRTTGSLALLEAWSGDLRVAEAHARFALGRAVDADLTRHKSTTEARLALAHVERERNRLANSVEHLEHARAIATQFREHTTLLLIAIEQARLHLARGTPALGLDTLREWLRHRDTAPLSRFHDLARSTEASLLIELNRVQQARALLGSGPLDAHGSAVAVRAALLERDYDSASSVLQRWPQLDEPRPRLEHQLWTAVHERLQGDRSSAKRRLFEMLPEVATGEHVRLLLDGGPLVRALLRDVSARSPHEFLETVLAAWPSARRPNGFSTRSEEQLTQRELEILRYLPTRLTTIEIAEHVYLSRNTLKTHLRHIYRKLDVTRREGAVAAAERLGLA